MLITRLKIRACNLESHAISLKHCFGMLQPHTYAVFSSIAGLVFQLKNRIVNLLNFKDVFNTKLRSHTVYKFMCSCCNATYYGQTQTFFVRVSEHLGNTPLTGKFVKTPKKSTIFYHLLLDGHKARFGNFSVLLKDSIKFKLQLKEFLLKSHDKPFFNKNIYSFPFELLY